MSMAEAVRAVLTNYATFSGRSRRSEYWFWTLSVVILSVVLGVIRVISFPVGLTLEIVVGLALLVPGWAVGCRRLHDTGKSGWLQLLLLIPIVGLIVLIVFFASDSNHGSNKYGPSPKEGLQYN